MVWEASGLEGANEADFSSFRLVVRSNGDSDEGFPWAFLQSSAGDCGSPFGPGGLRSLSGKG